MGFRRKIATVGKWLAMAGCIFLLSVFLCDVVTGGVARADMGPKPSITVKVVNGPQEYYIALLERGFAFDAVGREPLWRFITAARFAGL